jgi:hypothetical protein
MPIFYIDRFKTADINNGLLVSGDKSIIIDIDYCYQPTPIINLRYYNKSFSYCDYTTTKRSQDKAMLRTRQDEHRKTLRTPFSSLWSRRTRRFRCRSGRGIPIYVAVRSFWRHWWCERGEMLFFSPSFSYYSILRWWWCCKLHFAIYLSSRVQYETRYDLRTVHLTAAIDR